MKRELKPFVVEVKRGKRRSPLAGIIEAAKEQVSEAGRRADLALFASAPPQQAAAQMRGAETTGRILPSLIEAKLPVDPRYDEAPRRRGRKPGSKNKPKVPHLEGIPLSAGKTRAGRVASKFVSRGDASAPAEAWKSASTTVEQERPAIATPGSGHPEPAAPRAGRIRLRDRSAILARYVFETAPVPGERWKRPSRRKAARIGKFGLPV